LFFPARIAVAPADAPPELKLGAIFDANGYQETALEARNLPLQIADIAANSLAAAGLKPQVMNAAPGDLPMGIDFVLTSRLESLHCIKRYVDAGASNGAFVMYADARISFMLTGRGGKLYSAVKTSQLEEPRQGVDIAKYKPAFVHPDDAVSAVVSRATAKLIADPEFEQVLPRQAMPSASLAPSATPTAHPSPRAH
jgi:hypothetical protein